MSSNTELLSRVRAARRSLADLGPTRSRSEGDFERVALPDPVPLHLEQARARSAAQPHAPLASVSAGDARWLDWSAEQVDAVLLLGPLYHLTERGDRIRALTEARRVLRPNGVVLVAAISRFASALDGLIRHFFTDPRYAPITWQDLTDGHRPGAPKTRSSPRRNCTGRMSWRAN
jgi:ubiquinone/menaquinone biosynthesis C-methylase UbiE